MATAQVKHHDYHLVDPSPWPIIGSISAFIMAVGAIGWMHHMNGSAPSVFGVGVIGVLYTMASWWGDVIREAQFKGHPTRVMQTSQRHGLILTVLLGACFTSVQAYEYAHAAFGFSGNMYGATFFMATGFHGFHVLIGTVFLLVCLFRAYAGHFTPTQHLGFEFAAWYWHFVDVVWLFLFVCIYVWGRGAEVAAHAAH